ncbi:unnamed protein product [Leuciscus chuanchicus]
MSVWREVAGSMPALSKLRPAHMGAQEKVPPRFELGSLDSESRVLTITPWNLENKEKADQSNLASQSGNKRTQNKRFDQPQHSSKYFSLPVPSVRFTVRSHESVSLARLKQQSAPRSCVDATARGPKHCLAHYSPRKVMALPNRQLTEVGRDLYASLYGSFTTLSIESGVVQEKPGNQLLTKAAVSAVLASTRRPP